MHTPSNACVRLRSPSTTFTETRSVSPGIKSGTARMAVRRAICSASNCWIMFMAMSSCFLSVGGGDHQIRAALAGDALRFRLPPGRDGTMMARQQHVWYAVSLRFGGAGIVRIFQQTAREAFLDRTVVGPHDAGKQPDD